MFKVGDNVARRDTPNVLFGIIDEAEGAGRTASVRAGRLWFWADDGSTTRLTGRDRNYDIVLFEGVVPVGEKKFWIVRELLKESPTRYGLEEAAVVDAIELAKLNPTRRYGVFEAVSSHEVNAVTSTKYR